MSGDGKLGWAYDFKVIDISQPVSAASACFPGDTPFAREITLSFEQTQVLNLTAMTMSPHVGTHADAPVHVRGNLSSTEETAGRMPLEPFIGEAIVLDLAPFIGAIKVSDILPGLPAALPPRVLFRTCHQIRFDVFEQSYPYLSVELIDFLSDRGVRLIGIDTPSVDHVEAKELQAHMRLLFHQMYWLENLDLTAVQAGSYMLAALPLKFMDLEASPVRAVLLQSNQEK